MMAWAAALRAMGGEVPDASAADGRGLTGHHADRCLCHRGPADEERAAARHFHGKEPFMSRLNPWRSVSQATRKAALLCSSAVLVTALALAAAAPARAAGCPYVTGGRLFYCYFNGSGDLGQQATRSVDNPIAFRLHVNLSDGTVADVSLSDNTTYSAGTGMGFFSYLYVGAEFYVPLQADVNKQFPLYAIYHDPCKNVNWTFTVSLHVIP
jgi:hypothetical protein